MSLDSAQIFVAPLLLAACGALLGVVAAPRQLLFAGAALAHMALAGILLAGLLVLPIPMAVAALLGALIGLALLRPWQQRPADGIGWLLAFALAMSATILPLGQSLERLPQAGITALLVGAPATIAPDRALLLSLLTLGLLVLLWLPLRRVLLLSALDPDFAAAQGRAWPRGNGPMLALLALWLALALPLVGALTALGLLAVPAVAARLTAGGLAALWPMATLLACGGGVLGLASSQLSTTVPAGPAMVLGCAGVAVVTLALTRSWRRS